ncbi:MAG: glycosyltransferase family 2 protein [Alphaproteobacteria bacterium]|nr:glycosyltransferase family 2 protein [Alphaproteobacteria bacterium]
MTNVSIVVPCYNVEKYVAKCLDSLCGQTLCDIEIICIDDKSTDNTLKILRKYAAQDKRIKLLCQPKNSGVAAARNRGIKYARGEYVGFVDPDDWVDIDFYEKLYACAKETNAEVVKGGYKIFNVLTQQTRISDSNRKIENNHFYFTSEHQTAIFKNIFLKKYTLQYPEGIQFGEDSVFLSLVCAHYPMLVCTDEVIYNYIYNRPGSLDSITLSHQKVLSILKMLDCKINILNKTRFKNKTDLLTFERKHVLDNFMYVFKKKFQDLNDKERLFIWLRLNIDNFSASSLKRTFSKRRLKSLYASDFFLFCHPEFREPFYKKRFGDGRREIYMMGKKIFSYQKRK